MPGSHSGPSSQSNSNNWHPNTTDSKPLRGSEGGMKKNPTVVYPTNTSAAQAHPPSRTNINKALTSNGFRAPRPRPQPQPTYMYPTIPTQMPTTGALEKQLSFYFSIENLSKDSFLVSKMDDKRYVPVDLIASFPKIKHLTKSLGLSRSQLVIAMLSLPNFELDAKEERVRPRLWASKLILRDITVNELELEEVKRLVGGISEIESIAQEGYWWVLTLTSETACLDAVLALAAKSYNGKPIRCRQFFSPSPIMSYYPSQPTIIYTRQGPGGYHLNGSWYPGDFRAPTYFQPYPNQPNLPNPTPSQSSSNPEPIATKKHRKQVLTTNQSEKRRGTSRGRAGRGRGRRGRVRGKGSSRGGRHGSPSISSQPNPSNSQNSISNPPHLTPPSGKATSHAQSSNHSRNINNNNNSATRGGGNASAGALATGLDQFPTLSGQRSAPFDKVRKWGPGNPGDSRGKPGDVASNSGLTLAPPVQRDSGKRKASSSPSSEHTVSCADPPATPPQPSSPDRKNTSSSVPSASTVNAWASPEGIRIIRTASTTGRETKTPQVSNVPTQMSSNPPAVQKGQRFARPPRTGGGSNINAGTKEAKRRPPIDSTKQNHSSPPPSSESKSSESKSSESRSSESKSESSRKPEPKEPEPKSGMRGNQKSQSGSLDCTRDMADEQKDVESSEAAKKHRNEDIWQEATSRRKKRGGRRQRQGNGRSHHKRWGEKNHSNHSTKKSQNTHSGGNSESSYNHQSHASSKDPGRSWASKLKGAKA
ncbi:hypothetical protein AAMO2058_000719500 [Amorphochlora amoebiformis]|uniref:HTH La-type RNA-binding domain-containing protein n=1 Tax=Amorphochlora amoebiformis TaxID=1561963 RepID=A0A7S0H9G9_9EUKA|mmetsp:Transcript_8118/g.12622  ORF Transcript_8118/g.12622 Transcript_8118/m.12622 type:complete len:761 (+) Transcript_8118:41-2323(+)